MESGPSRAMIKHFGVSLLFIGLLGCDSPPAKERLDMSLTKIEALCARVAQKELALAPAEALQRSPELAYDRIYEGVKAECELEYRIKQQEASKSL
jgi:hypothetical protein